MTALLIDPTRLFRAVWRMALDEPGWAVLIPAEPFDSIGIRREMLWVLAALGDEAGNPFVIERLGRFDQQVTTKFHRDGAPDASLLILGYEPTAVRSRFFVADAHRAAERAGVGVNAFLSANNPMLPAGERVLGPFVTELTWPHELGAIVVVNNSLYPDDAPVVHPLGLLHKGVIEAPDPTARRVINSLGATPDGAGRAVPDDEVRRFVEREGLD
jgi:hypothetical protein